MYYYLYPVIDIFSRYVPGWMLARAERASLAEALLEETIVKQGIERDQLTAHADRGSRIIAKPVAHLLADLGVTKSHSRPHTFNENPVIESHFRTLKYRPDFPKSFGCYEDAHAHCSRFFSWYNDDHRHSGNGFHTPADVHYGRAELVRLQRSLVLDAAYTAHPERFVRKAPKPPCCPRRHGSTSRRRIRRQGSPGSPSRLGTGARRSRASSCCWSCCWECFHSRDVDRCHREEQGDCRAGQVKPERLLAPGPCGG